MKSRLSINQINQDMLDELESTNGNIRAILLVFQSNVEFYIDETIEMLFETTKLRSISFDKKMTILKELGYVSHDLGSDLKMLFDIRGYLAHQRKTHDLQTKIRVLMDLKNIKVVTSPKEEVLDEIKRFRPNMTESKLLKNFPETLKHVFHIFTFQASNVYAYAYDTKERTLSLKNMYKV